MRGHHGTFAFWQFRDHGADFRVQSLDLRYIGRTFGLEDGRFRRNGLHKCGRDIVDIGHRVLEALPGMRVESAMVMTIVIAIIFMVALPMVVMTVFRMLGVVVLMLILFVIFVTVIVIIRLMIVMAVLVMIVFMRVAPFFTVVVVAVFKGDRFDPFGRDDARAFESRRFDEAVDPTFKLKPVHEKKLGFADPTGIGGCGLIDMRVAVGTDERGKFDLRPADTLQHIAEDRKGRYDRDGFVRLRKGRHSKKENQNGG